MSVMRRTVGLLLPIAVLVVGCSTATTTTVTSEGPPPPTAEAKTTTTSVPEVSCASTVGHHASLPTATPPQFWRTVAAGDEQFCLYSVAVAQQGPPREVRARWCAPSGLLLVARPGSAMAIGMWMTRYDAIAPGELAIGSVDHTGDGVSFLVRLHVAPEVVRVDVTAANGATVAITPDRGLAFGTLSTEGTSVKGTMFDLVVHTATGERREFRALFAQPLGSPPGLRDDCLAPLPAYQPTDREASVAAATSAVATLFDRNTNYIDEVLDVPQPAAEAVARAQAANAGMGPRVAVRHVTFRSEHDAVARVDLYLNSSLFNSFDLEARRIDGSWKITGASVCAFLAAVAAGC